MAPPPESPAGALDERRQKGVASVDRQITEEELASSDGRDGRPAWIAYRGQVYDVSGSRLWPAGGHMRRHQVGRDLTVDLAVAPHDESVLQRLPVVGRLASVERRELPRLVQMYLDLHPHPVSVHFPIALTVASAALTAASPQAKALVASVKLAQCAAARCA